LEKLEIFEYTPLQVKIAVTGYGRSGKREMMAMIERLIRIPEKQKYQDDEYDAIAVGLTHIACKKTRTRQ
jgi:crossover junction endodeoxyribonuclease RuvC